MSSPLSVPSSPVAAPPNTIQSSAWNISSVLNFQPSEICCGTCPKGDHCTSKLYPYTSNSIPGKSPQAMQEEVLTQLVSTHFRSSAKTKELLHKLTGLALCTEHRRQQDRFERRWIKDIEGEKVRRRKEEERRQRRIIASGLGDEDEETPESPTPIARGGPRRSPTPGTKSTRNEFNRLASRGPGIPAPVFITRSGTNAASATHWEVPSVPPAFPGRGLYPLTPRITSGTFERRPMLGGIRRDSPTPSINPPINTERKYSFRSPSLHRGNTNLLNMATKIPKPVTSAVRRPIFSSTGEYLGFDPRVLPMTPAFTPSSQGLVGGARGRLEGGDWEEVLMLQRVVFGYQEKILRDQGRIFEILGGW